MAEKGSVLKESIEENPKESVNKYKKGLVFSKILKTNAEKDDDFYRLELRRLPNYVKGNRESRGKGFRPLDGLFEITNFYIKIHSENNPLGITNYIDVNRILKIQYVSERYTGTNTEPTEETVDIFWIRQYNLILMNGPKKLCEDAYNELTNINKVEFTDVVFKHDFLMWIPYRLNNAKGKLFPELFVNIIADGVTQNKSSTGIVPKRLVIDKSIEALMTLPAIYGLVNKHKFYSIGGDFDFRKEPLRVTISNNGIHIKITSLLKHKDHGERCAIVFPFIIEMVNVLKYWEGLDAPERYPDEAFLEEIENSFNNQILECQNNLEELKKEYKEKRET
ncbi:MULTISPECIES: hypothetical protein [Methanobacterium]|uniref:Uncharacterized protein n=1 Tax=Methanobacterium veterum TaxID=408577 RepID=A0A9E4ZXJ3_9EURY|nr:MULTISPECIES: hypothetical protein [Methanobacterium]MCZ3367066.1 hypothetical protein [Methanobacterium veterum]MCZ3373787.1 hypothetical protein [Methanobacterium veterum]